MNQVKIFVSIMLAVGMMQLNASEQPWERRTELVCAIEKFQHEVLERDLAYQRMLSCFACCFYSKDKEEEIESLDDRLMNLKFKLQSSDSSLGIPMEKLKDIAKTVKWMRPNLYEGTKEYQKITDICSAIIDRNNQQK